MLISDPSVKYSNFHFPLVFLFWFLCLMTEEYFIWICSVVLLQFLLLNHHIIFCNAPLFFLPVQQTFIIMSWTRCHYWLLLSLLLYHLLLCHYSAAFLVPSHLPPSVQLGICRLAKSTLIETVEHNTGTSGNVTVMLCFFLWQQEALLLIKWHRVSNMVAQTWAFFLTGCMWCS